MNDEKDGMEALMLTARGAGKMFNISPSHVRRLEEQGKFPPKVRLGRSVRYSWKELTAWGKSGCPPMSAWRYEKE